MKHKILIFIGIFILILIGIITATILSFEKEPEIKSNSMDDVLNNCKNLNLINTAKCLNYEINQIYEYNITRLGYFYYDENYYDKLKLNGGTCDQWAKLYNILAKKLGFNSEEVIIFNEENTNDLRHSISIIYDKTNYCIMDQTIYWCNGEN